VIEDISFLQAALVSDKTHAHSPFADTPVFSFW